MPTTAVTSDGPPPPDMGTPGGGCGDGVAEAGVYCFVEMELREYSDLGGWAVDDFDDDGRVEIALRYDFDATGIGTTVLTRWNGTGLDVLATHDEWAGSLRARPVADGPLELIGGCSTSGLNRLWWAGGELRYGESDVEVGLDACLAAIDADGDGAQEIMAAAWDDGPPTSLVVDTLRLDDEGRWLVQGAPLPIASLYTYAASAVGDADGDGGPELVLAFASGPSPTGEYDPERHRISVFRVEGAGFAELWSGPAGFNTEHGFGSAGVGLLDLDRDGALDLLVSSGGNVTVARGSGDGSFREPKLLELEDYSIPSDGSAGGNKIGSVSMGDIDGDGVLEVVATVGPTGAYDFVVVDDALENATSTLIVANEWATGLTLRDINHDGIDDVLTTKKNSDDDSAFVLLYLSDP